MQSRKGAYLNRIEDLVDKADPEAVRRVVRAITPDGSIMLGRCPVTQSTLEANLLTGQVAVKRTNIGSLLSAFFGKRNYSEEKVYWLVRQE